MIKVVRVNQLCFRTTEVDTFLGDPLNEKERLGRVPEITVKEMYSDIFDSDLNIAKRQMILRQHGCATLVYLG